MKTTRTTLVAALVAALLMSGWLPSASSADRDQGGAGPLHQVNVEAKTLMVGRYELTVSHRSRFFDRDGSPLSLADLVEHEWEHAIFSGSRVGTRFYLTKLELRDEDIR